MLRESETLSASYDYSLVILSVLLAVCASYTALDLAGRMAISSGRKRLLWLIGGASAMGFGIWSMHYIGMLAFRLPIHVCYDWPTVCLSLVAAILASAAALFAASREGMTFWRAFTGSIVMGAGIGAMHYIGMAAMRMPAMCHFNLWVVFLSVVLAIVISFAALWLVFIGRDDSRTNSLRRFLSAIAMGAAIPVLHYTGMAAASFTITGNPPDLSHAVNVSILGAAAIALVAVMVLGVAALTSAHDRLGGLSDQSMRTRVKSARLRAGRVALMTCCVMCVYEATKQLLRPAIAIWPSHLLTILFTTVLAGGVSYIILRQEERIRFELAGSEERYRSLFERSLSGVYRTTLQGSILDCNDAFGHILGYDSREEVLGDSAINLFPDRIDRARFTARLQSENVVTNYEHCLRRKDGSRVWILENAALLASEDPANPIIEGSINDISERRRAGENLHRLAAIVSCSDDAIISKDTQGIIQTWNKGAEHIYGYTAEETIGRSITMLAGADRLDEVHELLEKVRLGQEIKQFETVRKRKDGQEINIALTVSPIEDSSGHIVGASTVARDVTAAKRAQEALRQSEVDYRLLFDACPVPMWVFDRKTLAFLRVNEAAVRHYGFSRKEFLDMTIADIRPAEDIPNLLQTMSKPVHGLQELELWRHRKKDGSIIDVEIVSHDLNFHGIEAEVVAAHDITERKQAEQALQAAEEKYRVMFEDAIAAIFQSTPNGRYKAANQAMARMLGYDSPQDLITGITDISQQVYVDSNRREEFKRLLKEQGTVRNFECQIYRKDGSKMWISASARAVFKAGVLVGYEGMNEDITARKVAEERVQFLAYYDSLTGLPNRTLLHDRLGKALASARRRNEKVGLLFLDLDRFKNINDSLGHSCGDLLLQEVSERLKKWAREQDTVARIGGDEFVIVLTGVKDIPDAAVAAERVMDVIAPEFLVQGRKFNVTCSLGISIFPEHGDNIELLVKNADAAMYCAKESGRNAFRFFSDEMNTQVVERLNIEHNLRLALKRQEFFLLYQPQIDIASGKIIGMEALLRWEQPELGLVPPDRFIRVAENTGVILQIGDWVLRAACSAVRKLQDEGISAVPVAVNVSAVQFRQEQFSDVVKGVLQDTGLAPQFLELELTESLLLSTGDLTLPVLQHLKAMGVRLAIDDFGTGYSSLSYLRHFPVHRLKIDRSFIQSVAENTDDAAITSAIISMGKSLNLKIIAEGVENEAQMTFLRACHCDEIQGYYFSKPLTLEEMTAKLRSHGARRLSAHQGL